MKRTHILLFSLFLIIGLACEKSEPKKEKVEEERSCKLMVKFERDSAYAYIEKQLSFGPRVPGTSAHSNCATWIVDKFESFGLHAKVQKFDAMFYTGEKHIGKNIIVAMNPEIKNRVLLAAHWDSRPWADQDVNKEVHNKPVPGANDGASGVAVLIELARVFSKSEIPVGVDIVLFDLEDAGENEANNLESWGIGSQYWSNNKHIPGYKAQFGILLDMVGAKNARFAKEEISRQYAGDYVDKTWRIAKLLGHGNYFSDENGRGVTDDHYFVNVIGKIPMLDIIHTTKVEGSSFFEHWHTQSDDINSIDRRTLGAVGDVLMNVLCYEADGRF